MVFRFLWLDWIKIVSDFEPNGSKLVLKWFRIKCDREFTLILEEINNVNNEAR